MIKVIGFIRRRPDFSVAAFSDYWRTTHRAHAETLRPWLRGYVQDHLLAAPIGGWPRPADGCPVLWLDGPAAIDAMLASDEYTAGAYLDEPRFMEGRAASVAVAEEVRVPPPQGGLKALYCWRGDGVALAALDRPGLSPLPGMTGHIRNVAVAPGAPGADFDLIEALWWPDAATMTRDLAGATLHPAADPGRSAAARVETVMVFPPPRHREPADAA